MDYLIHLANILILGSFLVRDMVWLRLLSVLAGVSFIFYFGSQAQPLWEPVVWNGLFIVINGVQIARLIRERRPVYLTEEQEQLRQLVFRSLKARDLLYLVDAGRWRELQEGERLCAQGEAMDELMVIYTGSAQVSVGDAVVAELGPGMFVGEMGFMTDEAASAAVTVREPMRCLAWPKQSFRARLLERPELRAAMQFVLGADMARKLKLRQAGRAST